MNEFVQGRLLGTITSTKKFLASQENFVQNEKCKAVYVALLTLEGAILFDDTIDFGDVCTKFCERKAEPTAVR